VNARARLATTTAVLLVVAAGAVAVASFGVRLRRAEQAAGGGRGSKLFAVDPARVREVRVAGADGPVRLVRDGAGWRLTAPVEAEADRDAVARLLDTLAGLRRRATSAPAGETAGELRFYGLDRPRTRLEIVLDDGRVERLALGDDNGFDGTTFAMPTSGEVVFIPSYARLDLEQSVTSLRGKPPAPAAPSGPAGPPPGTGAAPGG
jgi:hypothetical protein